MFCKASKILLPLQDKVTEKLDQIVRQGILEQVQPRGVTNASPVVWQRKKSGELRPCVDLKVHINGKVMDEDNPISDKETIFHKLPGAHTLEKLTSQMTTIKLNLTKSQKIYAQSTNLKDCSRCADYLSSSIFQNCIESTLKGIKVIVMFQEDVLVYGTTREQLDKRMIAVKIRRRVKKSNSKLVDSVSFWDTSFQQRE